MEFKAKEIKNKAKLDYEKTWLETADLLVRNGRKMQWPKSLGKKHPVIETELKFRDIFLKRKKSIF